MDTDVATWTDWLVNADVSETRLTTDQRAILQAAFAFRQHRGGDYFSTRLLSHFLLHSHTGLKVAQIARLLDLSRSAASAQQGLSSKEVVQAAYHRLAGRAHGKLLPRFAGPIAQFLFDNPKASRYDLLDFIARTWQVRISRMALHRFLKKYGLDQLGGAVVPLRESATVVPAAPPAPASPFTAPSEPLVLATTTAVPVQPVPLPPRDFFFGPTQYAGAFLMLPTALNWLRTAEDCFDDAYGSLRRGFLTSTFSLVVGLPRIFHLQEMEDRGFALLTGGLSCPSRHSIGAWRRHLPWYKVDAFCRRTAPWQLLGGRDALVSFDEHTIPRWTHKFSVRKGYCTIRNKYMRCEKLYYGYDVERDRFLCIQGTPGHVELRDVAIPLVQRVLQGGQPRTLHALFDAGAGKADANIRALWDLVERTPDLNVTVRACRYPTRMQNWKQLPSGLFVAYDEPGAYVGAPAKEIRLAETTTTLKDEPDTDAVRTIVCREVVPGPKKDRWHPLYTTSDAEAVEILETFRQRQHHEQGYRVGVHDLFLNATPCGYDKESPDPKRPRFHRGPLQMVGWLIALLYNAVADLSGNLPERLHAAHVQTLRRVIFNRPGELYCTSEALIVFLEPFRGQDALLPLIDEVNAQECRLPWLGNRRLVISTSPCPRARSGP